MTTNQTPVAAAAAEVAEGGAKRPLPAGITRKYTAYNADPRRITFREGWNNRFDYGDIENLATGILSTMNRDPARPFKDNIDVKRIPASDPRSKDYDFEVVAGHRRMTAAHHLLKKGIQFPEGVNITLVDAKQDDLTSLLAMFNENNKKPLLPLEEAAAYKRMREETNESYPKGMTILQIAKAVGKADTHVIETLALLDADEDLQDAVRKGEVGTTVAKVIATAARGDKEAQKDLLKDAKEAGKGKGKTDAAKAAKARMEKKIRDQKAAKAASRGKELKPHLLSPDALNELGARVGKLYEAKAKEAGLKGEIPSILEMVKTDDKWAAIFTLGAVMGLQAAAGLKVELDV